MPERTFKCLIIGDPEAGKTNLCLRYFENKFEERYLPSKGVEFFIRIFNKNDEMIRMQIFDTAGKEEARNYIRSFYNNTAAAIFVYDVTRRETFENLNTWVNEIWETTQDNFAAVLVGNKVDLLREREVLFEDGQKLANDYGMMFLESSAKTGFNTHKLFDFTAVEMSAYIKYKRRETEEVYEYEPL